MGAHSRRTRQAVVAAIEDAHEEELTEVRRQAREEGERDALRKMTTWLEEQYMKPDLDMTSPRGKALAEVAGELVEHFRTEPR